MGHSGPLVARHLLRELRRGENSRNGTCVFIDLLEAGKELAAECGPGLAQEASPCLPPDDAGGDRAEKSEIGGSALERNSRLYRA